MPNHFFIRALAFLGASVASPLLDAQACAAGETQLCHDGACACVPAFSGDLDAMAQQAMRYMEEAKGPALRVWLVVSRNEAYPAAKPIPPAIRAALSGYVDEEILELARFRVGGGDSVNLADMALRYGDLLDGRTVMAVTLVDVIVFRNEQDALHNAALWAHELMHVRQFREWGVDEFAARYVADPLAVEAPAYAAGADYESWRRDRVPRDD